MEQKPLIKNKLTSQIQSFSLDKGDLSRLFKILQERWDEAFEIEVTKLKKNEQTVEQYENDIKALKEGFRLKPTITSIDGKEIWGEFEEIINSPNFPEDIKSIYLKSDIPLQVSYNYHTANSFLLYLDFSKPDLFNLSFLPSMATPNESIITVEGFNPTWTHGVFNELDHFVNNHRSKMRWLHRHSIYDILLLIAGFPFGFWMSYKLSNFLTSVFATVSPFVLNAAYVYVFFASLVVFRLLFHYARWVWPLVNYKSPNNKSIKHQILLGTILLGIVTTLIIDLGKAFF